MFHKQKIANIKMDGDQMTVSNKDLNLTFKYSSIKSMYINNEMDEQARELEVSLKKLKRTEPKLADRLRMSLSVNGVSFSFTVSRAEGEPIALHVENEFRQMILASDVMKGSLAAESRKQFLNDDPNEAVYPVYFNGCGGILADDDEDEKEDEL